MGLPARALTTDERSLGLDYLGVPERVLVEALHRGYNAWLNADPHWPNQTAGTMLWSEGLAGLRSGLCELGWRRCSVGNVESVLSADGRRRIMWMRGTAGTGDFSGRPKSHREHGKEIARVLGRNCKLELFSEQAMQHIVVPGSEAAEAEIWVMLVRPSKTRCMAELSFPATVRKGIVTSFLPRIPLEPIYRTSAYSEMIDRSAPTVAKAVEVEVTRRRRDR